MVSNSLWYFLFNNPIIVSIVMEFADGGDLY